MIATEPVDSVTSFPSPPPTLLPIVVVLFIKFSLTQKFVMHDIGWWEKKTGMNSAH